MVSSDDDDGQKWSQRGNNHPTDPNHDFYETQEEEVTLSTRVTKELMAQGVVANRDRATLTMLTGPETGRVYSLNDTVEIGRGRDCEVQIDDTGVSRRHAQLERMGGRFILQDDGSRNGTFIGGERVKRHELRDGDRIQLGPNVQLRFSMTDDAEEHMQRRLYESSVRDPLTGIYNRRHFTERLASEIAYAVRHKTELALVMFDVDRFKAINDEVGHIGGDKVLKAVVNLVRCTIRAEDVLCRWGGEEFTVLARGIDVKGGVALAERIRSIVETARIEYDDRWIPVTVSLGVATLNCCEGERTGDKLVGVADQRLYEAKLKGRNRVAGAST